MQAITLTAPDISCEHCQRAIESALSEMPGINTVAVDVADKSVSVTFDSDRTTRAAIEDRMDEEGYPVQTA